MIIPICITLGIHRLSNDVCGQFCNLASSKLNLMCSGIQDCICMGSIYNISIGILTLCCYMVYCHLVPSRKQYISSYFMISHLKHVL